MRPLFYILLSVCCLLCSSYLPYSPQISGKTQTKIPFLDSLIKYDTADVVRVDAVPDSLNWQLLIASINNVRVGIINHPPDYLYVYKKIGNQWIVSDSSFGYSNYADRYGLADVNGDGVTDIKLVYHVMRSNELSTVLLFNFKDSTFRHSPTFDLINVGYDKATGFVRSSALGGNFDNSKELYRIVSDTLQFYEGIEMEIDGVRPQGELRVFKGSSTGEKILHKALHLRRDRVVRKFNKKLWKDDYGYFYKDEISY